MSKISGHGGIVVRGGSPNVVVHNSEVEVDIEEMIDEVTTSGSGGAAEGLPIIYKVGSVVIQMPDDDTGSNDDLPEALGLEEGEVISLYFKRGAAAHYNKVTDTIVRNVSYRNPQTGARRLTITCEYGTFSRGVSAPSLP